MDIDAAEQPGDALRNAFGDEFDGVKVKGLYEDDANIDEVVIFDPAKADAIVQKQPHLNDVLRQAQDGIPVTYDDVAKAFPEYFTPGTRVPEPDFHPSVYEQLNALDPDGGLTINPFTGGAYLRDHGRRRRRCAG